MSLYGVFMLIFVLAVINWLVAMLGLRGFLARTPAIGSEADLLALKGVVRTQMYQALLQIVLLVTSLLIGVYGLFTKQFGLLLIFGVNGVILVLGLLGKSTETRCRSLPVRDERFAAEYRRVCASWTGKPLPDF